MRKSSYVDTSKIKGIWKPFYHAFLIIHAWINWAIGIFSGEVSDEAVDRYLICKECKHNGCGFCKLCGCIIRVKVQADYIINPETGKTFMGCPAGKW